MIDIESEFLNGQVPKQSIIYSDILLKNSISARVIAHILQNNPKHTGT